LNATGLFGIMATESNLAIKFRITIEESFGIIQKLLTEGFETNTNTRRLPFFPIRGPSGLTVAKNPR
jgi:hypothetical protein